MKRKTAALLMCTLALAAFTGCGSKEKTTGTEAVAEEGTQTAASTDIEYNVDDYVKLGDYMDVEITLKNSDYDVNEEDVNNYADQLISYYKPYQADPSKTTVEKGDVVDVDYVGKLDGTAFDGGSAQGTLINTENNTDATRGTGYIEGFSDGLVGAKVGDTIDSKVTFPENYGKEELNGKEVTFTFTINSIQKKVTRETLDDAYVSENFQNATVDEFYTEVKSFLEQQASNGRQGDIRSAIIDKVTEKCTVDSLPEGLLEARTQEYITNFEKSKITDGSSLSDYLTANYQTTEEQFRKEIKESMKKNLEQELVFEAIAKKEGIEMDEEGFKTYISNLVQNGNYGSEDALYESYGADKDAGKKYLEKIYLGNKACDMIAEKAKVNYSEEDTQEPAEAVTESTEKTGTTEN